MGATAGFSLSLGIATVAVPLLAVRSGYSGTEVGILTALSALAQMATRICMGVAMRRLPDWMFIAASTVLLTGSCALLAFSATLVPFVVAQVLQGIARAFFWTGSQTHAVRVSSSSVGALASVNLFSAGGLLGGPALAGFLIESSANLALAVGAGIAAVAILPTLLLARLPPFAPPEDRHPGRIWRRPGVDVGCWAGVTAGAWRGLLSSYIPVALEAARQSPSMIGLLISIANAASIAGVGLVSRARGPWLARAHALGALAAGLGTAAVAPFASLAWMAGVALTVSGLGAGALQTVGPAIAADAVHPQERGDAIAAAGTFRAGALFAAPLAVAGLVLVMPLATAMGAVSLLIAAPAAYTRRLHRHLAHSAAGPDPPPTAG
ncbi:MAG: MFS transporter [Propionibacteriales bacterium]|nr:MFS transporter [Propionibacteriales bacterium]